MEFNTGDEVIWCKGACGNNIHRECFEQWAKSKPGEVRCVYCRTPWKGDEGSIKRITKSGASTVNHEGYVNVGSELGLSSERDLSSYHPFWVAREFGYDALSSSQALGGAHANSSRPTAPHMHANIPAGSTLRGDVYISSYGGVYNKEDGEYLRCSVAHPRRNPRALEGSKWNGNVWMSPEGDCLSVDGDVVGEY
jgi:hypothetical protein